MLTILLLIVAIVIAIVIACVVGTIASSILLLFGDVILLVLIIAGISKIHKFLTKKPKKKR